MENIFAAAFGGIIFILGAAAGSFMNVVILRGIKKESFVKGRSYCPGCHKTLTSKELIPIVSYVIQGGHCRSCGCKISPQYPIVEFVTALGYLLAFAELGFSPRLAFAFVLFPVLAEVAVVDIKIGEIPYHSSIIIGTLGVIAFVISLTAPQNVKWYEHIIGLFIISAPFAVLAFLGAMGGGDVQLIAAAGLLLGWSIVPAALIAFVLGAVAGIIIKKVKNTNVVRFGPFLSLGIAVSFLYGNKIIESYISLLR